MRILLVSEDIPYPSMGGLAKHVLNLARALVRAGHEVDLLGNADNPIEICGDEGKFGGRFFGELTGQYAGWKENTLGVFMPLKRSVIAKRFADIILKRAKDYDVVHYHGHFPNLAVYLPKDLNFVQTRHDQGSDCLQHTRFYRGQICKSTDPSDCAHCITANPNAIQRTVSKTAVIRYRKEVAKSFQTHKTVFVSDKLQQNFSRVAGPGPWGHTVHHFLDTAALDQVRENAIPLASPGEYHVSVAGKIYAGKGIEAFLTELAPKITRNMKITIAGDGPDEARLRAKFENRQIQFLGWCTSEKTLEVTAASHAVVVPSILEEAFGSTTLEGLMLGKPTFALDIGATRELSIYAAHPEQLRLHPDMESLVDDLLSFRPTREYHPSLEPAGAERALRQLLEIYRSSPTPSH